MKHFRIWWQKPRQYSDQEEERTVTFLELFYDLVYVVIIAQLAHSLSTHISTIGFLKYAFLFLMVWWAWFNGVMYHDLHGNNDIKTRVMTFLQMMAVGAMAVFAHHALDSDSVGFALSYGAFLLIITYLWWRTGVHEKEHRPLSTPYTMTYLVAALLTIGSIFIETPLRFYIWGFNLFLIVLLPMILMLIAQKNQAMKIQFDRAATISNSMVERFGLLTIIVLGEVIVGVVQGVAGTHHFSFQIGATGGLGMLLAIGIWWVYFDFVSSHQPKKGILFEAGWAYMHLPLTICIAAVGAAILNIINTPAEEIPASARILLSASVSISLLSIAIIHRTIQIPEQHLKVHRLPGRIMLFSAIAALIPGFFEMNTILFLLIMIMVMLTPIFFGIRLWVKEQIKGTAE
jgi:low temperature requirement protein LtrA